MYSERDLVLPAIEVIREHGGICDTSVLIEALKSSLELDAEDLELLPSGLSIRFDQIVRNLKSNKTLEEMELAEYYPGGFMLTDKGMIIESNELKNITVKYFAPVTNLLTPQGAMVEYVKDNNIEFKDSRQAARDIIKLFKKETVVKNDNARRETMKAVIEKYITKMPFSH